MSSYGSTIELHKNHNYTHKLSRRILQENKQDFLRLRKEVSYGSAIKVNKTIIYGLYRMFEMNYFNKINLSKVVKTVDFGVLVPIDINPDNKIISPPTRPFSSVIIIIGQ